MGSRARLFCRPNGRLPHSDPRQGFLTKASNQRRLKPWTRQHIVLKIPVPRLAHFGFTGHAKIAFVATGMLADFRSTFSITFMITVSLIEDDSSFSILVTRALSVARRIEVISTHPNAEEALRELPRLRPDVVLMDIKLPGMNGIECLRRLMMLSPPLLCHVLMLTEYENSELVFEALKVGASGYLLKDGISASELSRQIKDVAAGGAVMSPSIAQKVIRHFQTPGPSLSALSKREMEVLADLSDGLMYKEIGAKRNIALNTVRRHVGSIYSKLHVASRAHATRQYLDRATE